MDSPTGEEQLLPGLADPERAPGEVELAARRTIAALDADDRLEERDALLCQSLVTLARQYDRAALSSRAKDYAIANLHAQLLATIQLLPIPDEGGDEDDEWTKLEKQIEDERRAAALRDAT